MLCCAVLRAVPCCAVCAVLCCAVHAVLCCPVLCCAACTILHVAEAALASTSWGEVGVGYNWKGTLCVITQKRLPL